MLYIYTYISHITNDKNKSHMDDNYGLTLYVETHKKVSLSFFEELDPNILSLLSF